MGGIRDDHKGGIWIITIMWDNSKKKCCLDQKLIIKNEHLSQLEVKNTRYNLLWCDSFQHCLVNVIMGHYLSKEISNIIY